VFAEELKPKYFRKSNMLTAKNPACGVLFALLFADAPTVRALTLTTAVRSSNVNTAKIFDLKPRKNATCFVKDRVLDKPLFWGIDDIMNSPKVVNIQKTCNQKCALKLGRTTAL